MSLSSGALTLPCPDDHTGWRLQAQTNAIATGLGTNLFDVTESSVTDTALLPADANNSRDSIA